MFKLYKSKKELEINLFFKYVSWWKLITQIWGIGHNFTSVRSIVSNIRENTKAIKKTWGNNMHLTLPQVLIAMELLPFKIIISKPGHLSDWYFMDIPTMLYEMNIPKSLYTIERKTTWFFGIKRKKPIYKLKKQ